MPFGDKKTHPCYGMIGVHRQTGGHTKLFGSPLESHPSTIAITIHTAELEHDLSSHWFFAKKPIIEVSLSPAQYAEMITTPNVGNGVPCTIRYRYTKDFEKMPGMPDDPTEVKKVRDDFERDIEATAARMQKKADELDKILNKKSINKEDRKEIRAIVGTAVKLMTDSAPFVVDQFSRATEKVVTVAKGEIDAFVTNMVNVTGIKELRRIQALTDVDRPALPKHDDDDDGG